MRDGGGWNLNSPLTAVPEDIVQRIQGVTPRLVDSIRDSWLWSHCVSGVYFAKSGYRWLAQSSGGPPHSCDSWAWIWKLPLPTNIQFFAWQLCHDSLPVRVTLHQRGIPLSMVCPMFSVCDESSHHCLLECSHVQVKWGACGFHAITPRAPSQSMLQWLRQLVDHREVSVLIVMWIIWCARNVKVFEGAFGPNPELAAKFSSLNFHISKAFQRMDGPPSM